jgi:hypothetical protein
MQMDSSKTTNLTVQLPELPREAKLENSPEYGAPDECITGHIHFGKRARELLPKFNDGDNSRSAISDNESN